LYDEAELSRSLRRGDVHCPATALVCFENTHNFAGGIAVGPEAFARQAALARRVGAAVYLDGARLFDAAIALGVSAEDLAAPADAVMVCLSKSLGAPAGSVLCGSDAFIAKALRWRQRMGGGMRQAGYLAACGLVALRDGIERLAEDHRRARGLAEDIGKVAGLVVHRDPTLTYTNMVFFDLDAKAPFRAAELERRCAAEGVLLVAVGSNTMRLVCHRDIDDDAAQRAIAVLRQVLAASG
jgi:threonine aldolase